MAVTPTADVAYSFRKLHPVLSIDTADPTTATLAQIEQLLVSAGDSFRQRQYNDAIASYQAARNLLWGQLFPLQTLDEQRIKGVDLTRTLISYAAEWLNVLPVEQATAGVRPREQATLPAAPILGLLSANTDAVGTAAVADLALSDELSALGNSGAAGYFLQRATTEAPNLITAIRGTGSPVPVATPPVTTPPVTTPSPVTPSPVTTPPVASSPPVALPHPAAPPVQGPPVHLPTAPVAAPLATAHATAESLSAQAIPIQVTATPADPATPILPTGGGTGPARLVQATPTLLRTGIPVAAPVSVPPPLTVAQRTYTAPLDGGTAQIAWAAGAAPAVDDVLAKVYQARTSLITLPDVLIRPVHPADVAIGMAHAWYYEIPLGLAECYHALGDYSSAETWYLTAAGYTYLNADAEAPYLWARTASLYLDWGDSLFRDDDPASALPIYSKVLTADYTAPTTELYTLPALAPATTQAQNVIANLADPSAVTAGPAISSVIFDVQAQLLKIAGGLDFWGHWTASVPIWTFDYLQSVTSNFCQLAISTERDAINFWQQADAGTLTRLQLTQNVTLSAAEQAAAASQVTAAAAEAGAYSAAVSAAQLRASDARANAGEYAAKSADWSMHQALSTQLSGGEDGDAGQLNQLADQMIQGGYSISGDRGTLAAAESLTASRLQSQYEIDTMNRQAAELDAAATQAQAELTAANARTAAAQAAANAAAARTTAAQQLVAAFDQQRFTPDVWNAMGQKMEQLSQRYLAMAIDVAKRMQSAYNFENDTALAVIRSDYSSDAVNGMLAADSLMADVQSFTYDLVTSTAPKAQPVKQTISLATRYPFLFETGLRATGHLEFQTDLDDFDAVYPGSYAGRIDTVEIAIDGIVPPTGVSGTLANAGISHYRLPAGAPNTTPAVKHRVQPAETMIISDYDPRTDALVTDTDTRERRVFQGAGLASTWTLDLPPAINTLDYSTLTDVRLTITYQARYDPDLRTAVLAELAGRPGATSRTRPVPLRWLFPDAFFSFYTTGVLAFSLARSDFAGNESNPTLTGLSLVAVTTPASRSAGLVLAVTAPGAQPITVTTAADGTVATTALAAACTGQSAIGAYGITLAAAGNPGWVSSGALALDDIANIAMVIDYSFTPRG